MDTENEARVCRRYLTDLYDYSAGKWILDELDLPLGSHGISLPPKMSGISATHKDPVGGI